jgi:hypothetical protein
MFTYNRFIKIDIMSFFKKPVFDIDNHYRKFINDYELYNYIEYIVVYSKEVELSKYLVELHSKWYKIKIHNNKGCCCEINALNICKDFGFSRIYMISPQSTSIMKLPWFMNSIYGIGCYSLGMSHHVVCYFVIESFDGELLYIAAETTEYKVQFYASTKKEELFVMLNRRYLYKVFKEISVLDFDYTNLYLNSSITQTYSNIIIL